MHRLEIEQLTSGRYAQSMHKLCTGYAQKSLTQPAQWSSFSTMPSTTPKQKRTMAAAAHNPAFARKVGIPTSAAREFNAADTGGGLLNVRPKRPTLHIRRPASGLKRS